MLASVAPRVAEAVGLFQEASWSQAHLPSGHIIDALRLRLQPFGSASPLDVAHTLLAHQPFHILSDGTLIPVDSPAPQELSADETAKIGQLSAQVFDVLIKWQPGRVHPYIYVLSPTINSDSPHLYTRGAKPGELIWICVYGPHHDVWHPESGTLSHLILLTTLWLANYQIWDATGRWLGPEASHDLQFLKKTYRRTACWCGSGLPALRCNCASRSQGRTSNRMTQRRAK